MAAKTTSNSRRALDRNRDPFLKGKITIGIVVSILFIAPIIWMLFVSIKPDGFSTSTPIEWFLPPYTISNYITIIMDSLILRWLFNSFFVAFVTTILTLIITSLAAFAISQMKFRFKNFIFIFFLLGLMIPGEATIIPLYEIVKNMNLIDSYSGLILPMIASPLGVIILKSFFDNVPKEIIESAIIDGCSYFKLFYKIVLPLAKPAIAAIGIFTFIGSWNNFLWPYLSILSETLYTLPVGLPVFNSTYSQAYVLPMTANAIASIPVIIAFLLFEKQIVKGISFTGIKG
ncbi:L-arabinose transport system permease protein AraQ [Oceanobacillus picturae]|uniref:L-arabinose transport system permease protein AraQ n=2 Tax=Oceanobacillus TaxID=182709 RepID=W9AD90_9BACI|nr:MULTISPECIES: carbohydrate ABC transporter permease [Oceanobacillus]MCG3419497.1 carbohydrate ABC transporter permease [Oceanobacillus jordanicus]RIU91095.1 carbohydrate ABC transporter permease [Oceanobacillus picturae]GAQ18658.1 L-arabinose transport system permease protein AraQ [Oceanobacillus picturae]CDO03468.1 L-arabinose transport system permease protein AraQ [Oceanobacillus picturae]